MDDVSGQGAEDARPVDAGVLVEALVLGDDERLLHLLRDVVELDQRAPFESELGDEASVSGEELARLTRLEDVDCVGSGHAPSRHTRLHEDQATPMAKESAKRPESSVQRVSLGRARQKRGPNGVSAISA